MNIIKRFICIVLIASMALSIFIQDAGAYYADKGEGVTFTDKDGQSVTADASWEEAYPYGAFAFKNSEATVSEEGSTSQKISVYRLGGTAGRAEAYVCYIPAVSQIEEGSSYYGNAISAADITIQVEDPLPVAAYQPLGKAGDPLATEIKVLVDDALSTATTYNDDGTVLAYGDVTLYADIDAAAYEWSISDGAGWEAITGAVNKTMRVSREFFDAEGTDFRCVYTASDGKRYCTDSVKGEAYVVPEAEALGPIPEDLPLNPETTYSPLDMSAGAYNAYSFYMTFADGEWVKDIIVTAADDDISEADEFGTLTISDALGASVYTSANTLSLHVADNETLLPCALSFDATEMTWDKAGGKAVLTVSRSGGTQYGISVDYSTVDGTALAGQDYAKTSGTLFFYAGITTLKIEIPLINDRIKTEELKSFTVVLTNILGGGEKALASIENGTAAVSLFNSDKASSSNLATVLAGSGETDISSSLLVSGEAAVGKAGALTGTETAAQEESALCAEYAAPAAPAASAAAKSGARSFEYPADALLIDFSMYPGSPDYGDKYWCNAAIIASAALTPGNLASDISGYLKNAKDYWNAGFFYPPNYPDINIERGNDTIIEEDDIGQPGWSWEYRSRNDRTATFSVPNMDDLFSSFYGNFKWYAYYQEIFTITAYSYPGFRIGHAGTTACTDDLHYSKPLNADGTDTASCQASWPSNSSTPVSSLQLYTVTGGFIMDGSAGYSDGDRRARAIMLDGYLQRRYFANDFGLKIYTANDADAAGDGITALPADSALYQSMKPSISIVEGKGGVTTENTLPATPAGKLFVGSTLKITFPALASYTIARPDSYLDSAVYLTDQNNAVVAYGELLDDGTNGGASYTLKLLWNDDGAAYAIESGSYTINVVMDRVQDIEMQIMLPPDVPNVPDEVFRTFILGTMGYLPEYGCSSRNADGTYSLSSGMFYKWDGMEDLIAYVDEATKELLYPGQPHAVSYSKNYFSNLQWLKFALPENDRIVVNGRSYKGNEKITLTAEDFAAEKLVLYYYCSDYLTEPFKMNATIATTALYLDANCNGQIDGYMQDGVFIPTPVPVDGVCDTFICNLKDGGYEETLFAPVFNASHKKYMQYFLKVYYTMSPRGMVAPPGGADDKAQVLPAFLTSVTNEEKLAGLSREQKGYRYIVSGKTGQDNHYSSDNHPMYGSEATKLTYVDIPLGGDTSPPVLSGETYDWTPSYIGTLLYPFADPEPIVIKDSLAVADVPIAEIESFDDATGKPVYAAGGIAKLNGYLGSFTANDTFALCVQEQAPEIQAAPGYQSGSPAPGPNPDTSSLAKISAYPSSAQNKSFETKDTASDNKLDMSQSGNPLPELNVNYDLKLSDFSFKLSDYVTITNDGYDTYYSIGCLLASKSGEESTKMGFADANKDRLQQLGKFLNGDWKTNSYKTPDYKPDGKNAGKLKGSGDFAADVSVALVFGMRYDPVSCTFRFLSFAASITGSLSYRYQVRIVAAPALYVYFQAGISVNVSTGLSFEENVTEVGDEKDEYTEVQSQAEYTVRRKRINVYFRGRLRVAVDGKPIGYIDSVSIADPVMVTVGSRDKGPAETPYTVTLDVMDTGDLLDELIGDKRPGIKKIVPVSRTRNAYYGNLSISPNVYLEIGGGIGWEMARIELFFNFSYEGLIKYTKATGWSYHHEISIALKLRVVFCMFNMDLDLLFMTFTGDNGVWTRHFGWVGDHFSAALDTGAPPGGSPVTVSAPQSAYASQWLNAPAGLGDGALTSPAVGQGPDVPFQLSGYSSSGAASSLFGSLVTGYEYKLVTVGEDNYLVYTLSRNPLGIGAPDYSMLVLSKLKLEGTEYKICNPVDEANTAAPYIVLDDDGTGDLDFSVWTDGSTIRAAWISYWSQYTTQPPESPEDMSATVARNTVVKKGYFTVGDQGEDGLNDQQAFVCEELSTPGSKVFLPDGDSDGSLIFYAGASHYTTDQLAEENAAYRKYLDTAYPDASSDSIRQFSQAQQTAMNRIFGDHSTLNLACGGGTTSESLEDGTHLENEELTYVGSDSAGGHYYLAYTVGESRYVGQDGNLYKASQVPELMTIVDRMTYHKLFLRNITVPAGGAAVFGEPYLLRTLVDFERNGSADGVYEGGSLAAPYADPYFSNLQFMSGKLPANDSPQKILLFEMNGNTYYIDESGLAALSVGGPAAMTPFFENSQYGAATGKSEVVIGADSAGNISAVYTSVKPNTANNALFVAKYDDATGNWGNGRMLAMNNMQVYEDSVELGWSASDTEKAYYGLYDSCTGVPGGGGDLTRFVFSDPEIAIGENDSLLIVANGSLTYLKEAAYTREGEPAPEIVVIPDTADLRNSGPVGVYAVSFGVGEKSIGEVTLDFENTDFSAGSELVSLLSFKNTGDAVIRGSADYPVTVELCVGPAGAGESKVLDWWTVDGSISVGQVVTLSGTADALDETLPSGSEFFVTVIEDAYFGSASVSSRQNRNNLTLSPKAELGFERAEIKTQSIDENGGTVLSVDFLLGNRGTAAASDVFVQFSYQTGLDENGLPVYAPLDLASFDARIGRQEPLPSLSAAAAPGLVDGIMRLYNADDEAGAPGSGDDIAVNCGRTVTGTLTVPSACYCDALTGSLNIRAEAYSAADAPDLDLSGVYSSDHDEYNVLNNSFSARMEQITEIGAASHIAIPLGSTKRLPASFKTTTGAAPEITVGEILDDTTGAGEKRLGILYYSEDGYIVITPSSMGSGYIRITDAVTGSFKDVAYTVTGTGTGFNIFSDSDLFAFSNADGSAYRAQATEQSWRFNRPCNKWGGDDSLPYNYDLSEADAGAAFSFDTVCQSIDLYFSGTVRVSSTFPGFAESEYTCDGGASSVPISFGANPTYYRHTVTVTVLSETAQFDKFVEHFANDTPPKPADDAVSPQIYWSRSFPDTASILNGGAQTVTCYVLDNSGLAGVTLDGAALTGDTAPALIKHDGDSFWQFDLTRSSNGSVTVRATDISGNTTTRKILVDWFNTPVSSGASAEAPDLTARFELEDGAAVPDGSTAEAVYLNYTASQVQTLKGYYYNTDIAAFVELPPLNDGRFEVRSNGCYRVEATDTAGRWSDAILLFTGFDTSRFEATLAELVTGNGASPGRALCYSVSAGENSLYPITSVTLNGIPQDIAANQTKLSGIAALQYSGDYVLDAADSQGRSGTAGVTVKDIPVNDSAPGVYTVEYDWNQSGMASTISVRSELITGGSYVQAERTSGSKTYKGSYEYAITSSDDALNVHFASLTWQAAASFTGLGPGDYVVCIRDAQEPDNISVIATHHVKLYDVAVRGADLVYDRQNGSLSVTVEAYNASAGTRSAALVAAVYAGNGRLLKAGVINAQLQPMSEYSEALVLGWGQASGDVTVKIFAFDSLTSIKPLAVVWSCKMT
jgi:hypothetical protein